MHMPGFMTMVLILPVIIIGLIVFFVMRATKRSRERSAGTEKRQ